ncbi:hypothetical protein H696_02170 [Fonticula alba]|uniref:Sulfhydryl oxidase n=1 Tax=Fonticula alba TaxID=691883 RepID=A0A058ZA88_FONAL|nr:hypothetical protein H696_02170 [Fonticula alba]KCV71219.1 hypothetical protein H696_02170 [Fonticula alba]|eukprot:XP_009494342.1 hypothetical protein H696_02170 [Fonticula alba]
MILDADGKPCRACNSMTDFMKTAGAGGSGSGSGAAAGARPATPPPSPPATSASAASPGATPAGEAAPVPLECPPDLLEIGRGTWTFLHTAAAYYPKDPSPQHRADMTNLVSILGRLFPCGDCASHLTEYAAAHPPDTSSRTSISQWFCEMHNDVNVRLGKPVFDCARVLERWRDGPADGSC